MKWKVYWMKLIRKNPEDYELDRCKGILKTVYKDYREVRDSLKYEFNVFSSVGISTDENKHSALLASLLLEKDHESGQMRSTVLLEQFLKQLPILSNLKLDPNYAMVSTEVRIGPKTENNGGRIDLLISSRNRAIIIENKIYAGDQKNQLVRYYNYAKKYYPDGFVIIYLTLDGHEPSTYSSGDLICGKDFYCASYSGFITQWLSKGLDVVTESKPFLYYTIKQYLSIIKKMTMRDEFINILCDKYHAKDLSILLDNKTQLEKKLIDKYLIERIKSIFSKKGTDWEVETNPQFYNNIKVAFRPKYWKQLGLWHVVQIISGGCFYGLCVDNRETKRGVYPQAPLRLLQNGSNEAYPFGWTNIPYSMEKIVDDTTAHEIANSTWLVMSELADDHRIDFGYFNRDTIQGLVDKCTWIKSQDGSHEYICKDSCGLTAVEYELFVKTQRFLGVDLTWEVDNRVYVYFFLNDYKYWTMGASIEETVIINRVKDDRPTCRE